MARFFRRGVTAFKACPTVVGASPTRPELAAGVLLLGIEAISGFAISNSPFPTPDLDDSFTKTVPGEDTAADSQLTFWDDDVIVAVRSALAKGTVLKLVYLPYGDVPTKRCEVWNVTSTGVNDAIDLSKAGEYVVGFSVNARPNQVGVVPS